MSEDSKPGPSRVRLRLGAELRALRTLAGDTQRELAAKLQERHPEAALLQVQISRIENQERPRYLPTRAQVEAWLDVYNAPAEVRERVLGWLETAHTETRSWKDLLPEGGTLQGVARDAQRDARLIRCFTTEWIPGLLQTAEYARQLLPQVDPAGVLDVAASVAGRMERQALLYESGRRLEFLLAEPTLWWSPGEGVMPAQLDRLLQVSTLSTVELRILPARRIGAAAWHSFTCIEPADGFSPFVTTELVHGGVQVTEPERVAEYNELWSRLWGAALAGENALRAIRAAQ